MARPRNISIKQFEEFAEKTKEAMLVMAQEIDELKSKIESKEIEEDKKLLDYS